MASTKPRATRSQKSPPPDLPETLEAPSNDPPSDNASVPQPPESPLAENLPEAVPLPSEPVTVVVADGIARLTLNRAEKRNALSLSLLKSLHKTLKQIKKDRSIRVVVLAAEGKVFSSGHDLKEMTARSEKEYRAIFEACTDVMRALRGLPQPVIARVHALATAAGCQLVAACDLIVATPEASFATPGVKIGLFCTTPMVPLVRALPAKVALEMLLTGRPISAQRAYDLGFVNAVVPAAEMDEAVERLAKEIAAASPAVIRAGKRAFYKQLALDEADAYKQAVVAMTEGACHADAQEGMAAFLEKRPPQWRGDE